MTGDELFAGARWLNIWCAADAVSRPFVDYGDGVVDAHINALL